MPLNPGSLTLTFNPPGNFTTDRLHSIAASEGDSSFTQGGCTLQTISVKDKLDDTNYAEATDKVFTPWNSSIAGVTAEWDIEFNSNKYRIIGHRITPDALGRILQCMFIVKRETG